MAASDQRSRLAAVSEFLVPEAPAGEDDDAAVA
jgi:hypothetical protein